MKTATLTKLAPCAYAEHCMETGTVIKVHCETHDRVFTYPKPKTPVTACPKCTRHEVVNLDERSPAIH